MLSDEVKTLETPEGQSCYPKPVPLWRIRGGWVLALHWSWVRREYPQRSLPLQAKQKDDTVSTPLLLTHPTGQFNENNIPLVLQ